MRKCIYGTLHRRDTDIGKGQPAYSYSFAQGNLLEINEAVIIKEDLLAHLDYRYHFQDGKNHLIFRYDSVPHFPNLPSFPHHKHLPGDVIASEKPDIARVVQEALENLPEKPGGTD